MLNKIYDSDYKKRKRKEKIISICFKLLISVIVMFLFSSIYGIIKDKSFKRSSACNLAKAHLSLSDKEFKMKKYLVSKGSKTPDELAVALLRTQSPKLLARIAVAETNGNTKLRKYGYKKKHDGAFGVNRQDWGKVGHEAIEQAIQAEFALNTFVEESKGDLKQALNKYGGDKTKKVYAKNILEELEKVP